MPVIAPGALTVPAVPAIAGVNAVAGAVGGPEYIRRGRQRDG